MVEYKCEKCKKEFTTKSNLNRHLKKKNPCDVIIEYKCERCKKIFNLKQSLQRHINRKNPCEEKQSDEVTLAKIKAN